MLISIERLPLIALRVAASIQASVRMCSFSGKARRNVLAIVLQLKEKKNNGNKFLLLMHAGHYFTRK